MRQENVRRAELYYDVLFDEQFDDGGTLFGVVERRMFKMSPLHLLNITYGSGMLCNELLAVLLCVCYYYY